MRMWMIDPNLMCRQHLLGEHRELHTLAGSLRMGKSIAGFLRLHLLEPQNMEARHETLVEEMGRRGYNHQSPLIVPDVEVPKGGVDSTESLAELLRRCPACSQRIEAHLQGLELTLEKLRIGQ